jgi:hypothetical protein
MRLVRNAMLALAAIGFAVVAVPSCDDDGRYDDASCDYVVRRCRTFCDYGYGCDYYWGCCYDRCWYDCVGSAKPDPAPPANPPPAPSTPPPATDAGPAPDASPPPTGDFAVLCAPCTSNDECKGGGLCITRGGEDAGAGGFCGHPCGSGADCPADFTCAEIGQSKQCVPTIGTCN